MEYENFEEVMKTREKDICKKEKELKQLKDRYEGELERFKREHEILSGEIYDLRVKLQKAEDDLRKSLQEIAVVSAAKDAYHFCISKIFGGEK